MKTVLVLGLVSACTMSSPSGDETKPTKEPARQSTIEPPPVQPPTGQGSGDTANARHITCPNTQWVERHPDGSFREHERNFALVPGIDPTSNYSIEQCDHIGDNGIDGPFNCPQGDTCTDFIGAPYPITNAHSLCTWSKGQFWGGNLVIICEDNWDDKSADGTVLRNHSDSWVTTILHTW